MEAAAEAANGGDLRRLRWEGCFNARDLGGYATPGGRTRWRALLRSDSPARLTMRGRSALLAHGVRTVVDLRSHSERNSDPGPFACGSGGLCYVHVPLIDAADDATIAAVHASTAAARTYKLLLDGCSAALADAVGAIADAPAGAVLVHCQIGRDRTGLVCALLLAVAGVEPATIAADYALSDDALRPLFEQWLRDAHDPGHRDWISRISTCDARTMLATLHLLEERYGGAAAYLRAAGVDALRLERLRHRLVVSKGRTRSAILAAGLGV